MARTTTPPAASRRAVLSGTGSALILVATASGAAADPAEHPDTELIRLCAAYIAAVDAYDAPGVRPPPEEDPLWQAIEDLEEQLAECTAQTLEGIVAKARVARHLAQQLDGSENFSDSHTGDWPEQVIRDLLRLAGEG